MGQLSLIAHALMLIRTSIPNFGGFAELFNFYSSDMPVDIFLVAACASPVELFIELLDFFIEVLYHLKQSLIFVI